MTVYSGPVFDMAANQFNVIANHLEIPMDERGRLLLPKRAITVSCPIHRDDGTIAVFEGYRVQHHLTMGPTKGGTRFAPSVDIGEVAALAIWMSWKCALAGLPYGGAKGGVNVDLSTLSKRELESRYEVFTEQYVMNINIEAETAAVIARTMVLPAAVRYLNELRETGLEDLVGEIEPLVKELHYALVKLEDANLDENHPDSTPQKEAVYMRDQVIVAMADVRDVADRLEKLVADDLWPLPKYSEMLFIK